MAKIENENINWIDVYDGQVAVSDEAGNLRFFNTEGELIWEKTDEDWPENLAEMTGLPSDGWMCRIDETGQLSFSLFII